MDSYFSLLNLAPTFALDADALERAWREASARVHPDRFATASAAEKRVAMQWASRINQAYEVLRKPVKRAAYLCELAGHSVDAENNTRMDTAFLMKQMQWREELEEAAGDATALQALKTTIDAEEQALERCLTELLDSKKDYATASEKVRQLMFITKIQQEIQSLIA
ncbi:Fe-S protein assembly co-chaperone HscB [Pelistega suis]|uniref:Co-chaperone protein HscB homolog n=1 Tax=Pelistega suis TaxID=1631957 RepID=A0A849P9U2_9BURK|nr:Fe-S protein assembly co-chaperone HscB [Pelistega suis]NOL51697.1 Fe-S protein assembly co-chaperone HscB [Pelistega suis]